MNTDRNHEVIRLSENGRYRAVRIRDEDYSDPPCDDGATPILRIARGRWASTAEAHNRQAEPYVDAYCRLQELMQDRQGEIFERYLRIFHGAKGISSYGPNPFTDDEYLSFDTDEWAEQLGCPDGESRERAASSGLEETNAWLEGDMYGVVIEENMTGACGHTDCDKHMSWRELVDADSSIWGLYGDNEYTRVEVVDEYFGDYFETEKAA